MELALLSKLRINETGNFFVMRIEKWEMQLKAENKNFKHVDKMKWLEVISKPIESFRFL